MKEIIIKTITDKDFGYEEKELNNPNTRTAARAILIDNDGKIALFNKVNKNEYKLPGGGVDDNEDLIEALKREVLEETGCLIKDIKYIGKTIEIKNKSNFKQKSFVYICKVLKNTNELHLTQKEIDEGGRVVFLESKEALNKLKESLDTEIGSIYDDKYKSLFMVKRDYEILNYVINNKIID